MISHALKSAIDFFSSHTASATTETSLEGEHQSESDSGTLCDLVKNRDADGVKALFANDSRQQLIEGLRDDIDSGWNDVLGQVDNQEMWDTLIRVVPHDLLDRPDGLGRAPLSYAAENNNVVALKALLAANVSADAVDNRGYTALMWAAVSGFVDAVKVLLGFEAGSTDDASSLRADINRQDNNGNSALMLAIKAKSLDAVKVLSKHGARIDIANDYGDDALHLAVSMEDSAILKHLVNQCSPDLDKTDNEGKTLSMRAVDFAAKARGGYRTLEFLLSLKPDLEVQSKEGCTVLLHAARAADGTVLDALIKAGANINATDLDGASALHIASRSNPSGLKRLIQVPSIDVNMTDGRGRTPLFVAVEVDNYAAVEALLEHNADVNAKRDDGATALWVAQRDDNDDTVTLLGRYGAKSSEPKLSDRERQDEAFLEELLRAQEASSSAESSTGNQPV